jgi:hypothetical protein
MAFKTPEAFFLKNYELAEKLIETAEEKNMLLDTDFLLQGLIKGYSEGEYGDHETFYRILWKLNMLQKQQMPADKFIPLFHYVLSLPDRRPINMIRWLVKNAPEAFSDVNSDGNTFLMAIAKCLAGEMPDKKKEFLTNLLKSAISHHFFDLNQKNLAGETLVDMCFKLPEKSIANALQDALDKKAVSKA